MLLSHESGVMFCQNVCYFSCDICPATWYEIGKFRLFSHESVIMLCQNVSFFSYDIFPLHGMRLGISCYLVISLV